MDYGASMEGPSCSAGALKSNSSPNPQLGGRVTLFMSSNGDTSQRPPPLCAAHHQTMHQNIKSIHLRCIPVVLDERYGRTSNSSLCPALEVHVAGSPILNMGINHAKKFLLF